MKNAEVAKELGIHRVTLSNWCLHHPGVIAALNAGRQALWSTSQDRLRALMFQAMDAIGEDLASPGPGRAKLALELVKLGRYGAEALGAIGPIDPEVIVEDAYKANHERERASWSPSEEQRSVAADELLRLANEPPGPDDDPDLPKEPLGPSRLADD